MSPKLQVYVELEGEEGILAEYLASPKTNPLPAVKCPKGQRAAD